MDAQPTLRMTAKRAHDWRRQARPGTSSAYVAHDKAGSAMAELILDPDVIPIDRHKRLLHEVLQLLRRHRRK